MRRAKIVCTIGPASRSRTVIAALLKAGMNVARLNFSHGDHAVHARAAALIRAEAKRQKKTVSLLQDLQGIKIRVGATENDGVLLRTGQTVSLLPGSGVSTGSRLFISYPALLTDVREGDPVLLDDGLIKLRVVGATGKELRAEVLEGGLLKSKKGVNLPSSDLTLKTFTRKDREDLTFGLGLGVDYAAISFVRTAEDIEIVKAWAKRRKAALPSLIAKIEKPEALDNIDEIIESADGIMVARGDLGVEMPTEEVPIIQKMLIDLANRKGKLVITATQMLESMTQHTRPTRAEASDVANAVLDGTDALMLSAETASGAFPVEAATMMDTIIRSTEARLAHKIPSSYQLGNRYTEAIADGASNAAQDVGAKAIVVFTNKGFTARLLAKLRPQVPIIAYTPDEAVWRQMPLYWGVTGRLIQRKKMKVLDAPFMADVEKSLLREGVVKRGDGIVFVASSPFLGKPNVLRLYRVL